MNKEMILNLEDLNSILNYLNIDKDEYFKKLNLIAEKIEGKMQEPYFLRVLDTETMEYMFYRIKNDSSEIFQYENEHKWLMDCLKNADSKFQGIEEALRTLMIKKYYNFWNQKNSSKIASQEHKFIINATRERSKHTLIRCESCRGAAVFFLLR